MNSTTNKPSIGELTRQLINKEMDAYKASMLEQGARKVYDSAVMIAQREDIADELRCFDWDALEDGEPPERIVERCYNAYMDECWTDDPREFARDWAGGEVYLLTKGAKAADGFARDMTDGGPSASRKN